MRLQLSACLLIVTFTTSCGGLAISKPHAGYDVVLDDSASIATSPNEEPNSELARRETSEAQSPDIVQRRSLFSNLTSLGDSAKDFVMQEFAQVFSNNKTLTSATVAPLEALGITGATDDGSGAGLNGFNNSNPNPSTSIYPQRSSGDAPYSNSETALRGALYIPSGFQSNKTKQPILMCPGTGALGGQTYENNMLKLFQQSDSPLDPVILNVPGFLVDDIQSNSEFVAYGINYLTATTGKSIAVMTWSQGSLNVQWAMKYWPSSRQDVSDVIAISPDLKGSILEPLLCNSIVSGCGASIRQQSDSSEFVKTLRADGGDSAYVPVTTIYSATDEIVQPQFGANASGIFNDARGVGVTNNEIQSVCGNLRDQVFLHESVLFSNLAYNLALDAVANDGPGQTSRLDLNTVCGSATPDALSSLDILQTESVILTCLVNIVGAPQTQTEPSIKSYAQTAAVGKSAATSGAATKGFSVGSGVGKSGFGWAKVLTFYALVTYFLVL